MGRDWRERKYISVDVMWQFIDEHTERIQRLADDEMFKNVDATALLFLGRKEALADFGDQISDEGQTLSGILKLLGVSVVGEESKG